VVLLPNIHGSLEVNVFFGQDFKVNARACVVFMDLAMDLECGSFFHEVRGIF
jgi:hypothetical protein